jgi:ADP-ribosyl-[dinitrogen reductase] hydrolase
LSDAVKNERSEERTFAGFSVRNRIAAIRRMPDARRIQRDRPPEERGIRRAEARLGAGVIEKIIERNRSGLLPSTTLDDRVSGCLLGAAVGAALGAPYDGEWGRSIPSGKALLSRFAQGAFCDDHSPGRYSDETHLMLAGVEAVIVSGGVRPGLVAQAMANVWTAGELHSTSAASVRALARFHRTGDWITSGAPDGYADNGPAVRSAPLGLYFLDFPDFLPETVAELARITHGDARSVAGAVAIAAASQLLATRPDIGAEAFADAVASSVETFDAPFAELLGQLPDLAELPRRSAVRAMASAGIFDRDFDQPIITSFVIPTVLASFWSVLRHGDDWGRAVASVIRLGGNVDALGAIVGALVGVKLGVRAIPQHLANAVQDSSRIRRLSSDYAELLQRRQGRRIAA